MKIGMLVVSVIGLGLASTAWADEYEDLAAKGYRWVTVNGPYACTNEQEVHQISSGHTDATELQMTPKWSICPVTSQRRSHGHR
jgi:hypothetical protein